MYDRVGGTLQEIADTKYDVCAVEAITAWKHVYNHDQSPSAATVPVPTPLLTNSAQ